LGQQTRKQKIRDELRKQRRRRVITSTVVVAVLMVAVVVGIILLTPKGQSGSSLIGQPISPAMAGYLQSVSNSSLSAAVNAQGVTPLQLVSGSTLTSNGKPEFLYIGAEFCPFCAAERWSIIVALSKFGTFSGLTYTLSGDSPEVYPDTATFSFLHATYNSPYVSFVSVETADRSPNHNPLQTPTAAQQSLIDQWDPGGGIPFLDIGGVYVIHSSSNSPTVHSGTPYDPGILSGQNWTQIGAELDNPVSSIALHVDGEADWIISAVCKIDNGQPMSICSQNYAQMTITQAPIGSGQMPPANNLNLMITSDILETHRSWNGSA
jgi:hypothetical protein